jgi:16S rRNA (uracil1498-N3)-methyltransferase
MSLPFFYEENISTNSSSIILSEETSRHCVQVLRMQVGVQLQLTNGRGAIVTASIIKQDKRACVVNALATKQIEKPARHICIGISLLKNANRFEWFLEKATETGISEIMPLLCARTERQHSRYDRMKNIIISAMLQSQQAWLPVLHQPVALSKLVNEMANKQKLVAHCLPGTKQTIKQLGLTDDVLALIGPEGDFTEDEINNCLTRGFVPVTLGNTRLRTETAGITAAILLANN